MSNPYSIDTKTGFLESRSTANLQTFNADKKTKLLELAGKIRAKGKWPNLDLLCKAVGVVPITLERHLKMDSVFADEWRNVMLSGKFELESMMFDLADQNPAYMFGWLRRFFPEHYNDNKKVTISHVPQAIESHANAIDAELVEQSTRGRLISDGTTGSVTHET